MRINSDLNAPLSAVTRVTGVRALARRIAVTAAMACTAAAVAVLAFGPAAPAAVTEGWYGYVVTGSTYTSSTATWTMGAAHCSATAVTPTCPS